MRIVFNTSMDFSPKMFAYISLKNLKLVVINFEFRVIISSILGAESLNQHEMVATGCKNKQPLHHFGAAR
jgi:hypothetical protein